MSLLLFTKGKSGGAAVVVRITDTGEDDDMMWLDVDTALSEVPVNLYPLTDDTDFKTIENAVAFNAAGMDLVWNFVTTAGAYTQTAVTPTAGGTYDWTNQGKGMYSIEIPATGGVSINNDTEGFGWFTGVATGVLPWRGPIIGLRAAGLNNAMIDNPWSASAGLAGTDLATIVSLIGTIIDLGSGTTIARNLLDVWTLVDSIFTTTAGIDTNVTTLLSLHVGGPGPNSVTITVQDSGNDPVEGAVVSVTNGVTQYTQTTNVSGVVTFSLPSLTWVVAIYKPLYTFSPVNLVVNGTENETYTLTTVNVTASTDPDQTTGYMTVLSEALAAEQSVVVMVRMINEPPESEGFFFDKAWVSSTSSVAGLVQFALVKGATYEMKASGQLVATTFWVPDDADTTWEIGSTVSDR